MREIVHVQGMTESTYIIMKQLEEDMSQEPFLWI